MNVRNRQYGEVFETVQFHGTRTFNPFPIYPNAAAIYSLGTYSKLSGLMLWVDGLTDDRHIKTPIHPHLSLSEPFSISLS